MTGKVTISEKLMEKKMLPVQDSIYIRAGARMIQTRLIVKADLPGHFNVSPDLSKALHLKPGRKLQLRFDKEEGYLHIGPTIGILTNALPRRDNDAAPNSSLAEIMYLSRIAKTMAAQVFIFTPHCINWDKLTTRGYLYKPTSDNLGIWESAIYPLPDVVYDRIPSRSSEARVLIKNTKERLMNLPFLKYFNPSFLNKWQVYKLLCMNEELLPYLPETMVLNRENLEKMLPKYQQLFIKPANGSLGRGIIIINRHNHNKISYTVYSRVKHHGSADSPTDFLKRTNFLRQKKAYIVQQGINLAKYHDSAFDLRIIYQKDHTGNWMISKKFVRVAARGSSISNLSRGGRAEKSKKVLTHILHRNKSLIEEKNNEIKLLCETVACTLEKNCRKLFGELGLDIGIDNNGKLWLIEVNSKPRKTTVTESSQRIMHNTFKRPLEYAAYLAGFNNTT
ncbi:Endospore coat-associated protein YheC/D [Syntrophomonas zehnderi OL-4]|uniref:Endospore coat-associated protein YheC/D n=1 Tax=Syntrophomonas zehnderi OL-4 TaxID=690567 RepID=A0A0E3W2E6_9FIRM|nr:YheC/YheD family protein [Syntrophomonas zehnderi]CFW96504.1 Endospore coat-associated protein YheC/D [Syntrophomonas zehnderi OL-4]